MEVVMGSPKTRTALARLGKDIRSARLRRGIAVADLALRAGTSPSSITRLEKGDPGVGIGTLADILVVLSLVDRLADLVDIRNDELGLALSVEQLPQRGRSSVTALRKRNNKLITGPPTTGVVDQDGVGF